MLIITSGAFAQGTIRGEMFDAEFQESIIGGVVKIEGTSNGAVTDLDGQYSIQVPAGTYNVIHSYVGYTDKKVTGVVVTDGEVISLGRVVVGDDDSGNEIEEVVITVETQKNSEEGLLTFQMNNTKIVDAVSAQSIAKTGDSDVAAVVKRVPGVTIEGGKYVYVRGLGDRYSKSIINGMEIPGLDPERNTVQMDIFPSNIIDNITVYKTFSPDLPGDFTGGMVDVTTKDFPLEKSMKLSTSLGYNSVTTLNNDFLLTKTTFADALGFGKSNRDIPIALDYDFGSRSVTDEDLQMTKKFNNVANPTKESNFLNTNFAFSYDNQYDLASGNRLGLVASASHSNSFNFRPKFIRNDLLLLNGSDGEIDTENSTNASGANGSAEGILNGLIGAALKNDKSSFGLKLIHTRAGENSSLLTDINRNEQGSLRPFQVTNLGYYQRQITNLVLDGEHYINNKDLSWGVSGTVTGVDNPDLARTDIFNDGGLSFGSNSNYTREWRELSDKNINAKVDYKMPISITKEDDSFLKAGAYTNYKTRDYAIYVASIFGQGSPTIPNANVDNMLKDDYLAGPSTSEGFALRFDKSKFNAFEASSNLYAGYLMGDLMLTKKLQFIGGARAEQFAMNYKGKVRDLGNIDTETLNELEILPSANFVYEIKDFMKARASYNRTLARPSFREKSGANILDPIQGRFFNGNIDLTQTLIDNYDLRWEYFFDMKEMVSISPFFKKFKRPIEILALDALNLQPRNQNDANVYGFEFELRKDLGFVHENWKRVSFNGNFTFVKSEISLSKEEFDKYNSTTVTAPENRTLLGQSPYSINAGFDYRTEDDNWGANLSYNVKGKTLSIVGIGLTPNVYEDPFHNLDFKVSKNLGSENRSKVSLKVQNILNDNIDYFYEFDGKEKGIYNSYDVGQSFSVGYSYKFFGE